MKKRVIWFVVSVLIVVALVLTSCGSTASGEQEEEEDHALTTLRIGETFQSSEVVVTASDSTRTDSYEYPNRTTGDITTEEADPGMSFLIIAIETKNVGNLKRDFEGRTQFRVIDSDGNEYTNSILFGEDVLLPRVRINPGGEAKGKVLFIIPEEASGLKIVYESQTISVTSDLVEWVLD